MVEVFGGVDDSGGSAGATVVVDEDVAHDGEHPALEVGVVGILVFVVESLEGGVLQQVVCVVAVGGEHVGKVQQVALELHEFRLGFFAFHNSEFLEVLSDDDAKLG